MVGLISLPETPQPPALAVMCREPPGPGDVWEGRVSAPPKSCLCSPPTALPRGDPGHGAARTPLLCLAFGASSPCRAPDPTGTRPVPLPSAGTGLDWRCCPAAHTHCPGVGSDLPGCDGQFHTAAVFTWGLSTFLAGKLAIVSASLAYSEAPHESLEPVPRGVGT